MIRSVLLLLILTTTVSCRKTDAPPKASKPAVVRNGVEESSLTEIQLTPAAERRLMIETEAAVIQSVVQTSLAGATIELPPAARIPVISTVRGRITEAKTWPVICQELKAGEALFSIQPLLNPEHRIARVPEQIMMAEQLAAAQARIKEIDVQIEAAKIALERATRLMKDRVGSQRVLDESRASLALLQAGRETALARLKAFESRLESIPEAAQVAVMAPCRGMLSSILVKPGQLVIEGSALAAITDLDRLWVRASVYAGELEELDLQASPTMQVSERAATVVTLNPTKAPPAADPLTGTVDIVYDCDNSARAFRPGQRVWLRVPHKGSGPALTIPYSAVLIDMSGGRWVYQKMAPGRYRRRRVEVRRRAGDRVVIGRGLEPGVEVVKVGAPELFGTEFWQK